MAQSQSRLKRPQQDHTQGLLFCSYSQGGCPSASATFAHSATHQLWEGPQHPLPTGKGLLAAKASDNRWPCLMGPRRTTLISPSQAHLSVVTSIKPCWNHSIAGDLPPPLLRSQGTNYPVLGPTPTTFTLGITLQVQDTEGHTEPCPQMPGIFFCPPWQ